MQPIVALDANILFAALLSSSGTSRRLLELALVGVYQPVITAEVLAEFDRHCRLGFKGRAITDAELRAFRAAIHPLLEYDEVVPGAVGRAAGEGAYVVNVDNRLNIRAAPPLDPQVRGKRRQTRRMDEANVELTDMAYAHVLASAVRYRCGYLCTANHRDFPEGMEVRGVRIVAPGTLLALLLEEDDEVRG